jgi:hypothetical protein
MQFNRIFLCLHFPNGKTDDVYLFKNVTAKKLNVYLGTFRRGLTIKGFRTYNSTHKVEDYVSLKAIFTFYIDIGLYQVNI